MPAGTPSARSRSSYSRARALRAVAGALAALSGIATVAASAEARNAPGDDGGGAVYVAEPEISEVACVSRCASQRRPRGGSVVALRGENLSEVRSVTFHGGAGPRDDVSSRVRSGSSTRVKAKVPFGAVSGPVSARAPEARSARTRALRILPSPPPEPNTELTEAPGPREPGAPRIETGTSRTRAYFGSRRMVTFSFRVSNRAPESVSIELVRAGDESAVRSWEPEVVEDEVGRVVWNGKLRAKPAPMGRYSFRLTAAGRDGEVAASSSQGDASRDSFDLYDHYFPVRGRHDYGSSGSRFGAGRGGRGHQGHDVFASCGTPMVAARGGRVQYAGYHASAGNYLVIDGGAIGVDYAYMHLVSPSPFRKGDRVYTGQRIGEVGDSGNASGCHLHFELWGAPGWYEGGSPFDPLPSLRAWDRSS